MRKLILLGLLLFAVRVSAQVSNPQVQYVAVAPSGACSAAPPIQVVISTGAVYTCNNGTWGALSGGSGTPGGSTAQVQYNNVGAFGGAAHFKTDGSHQAMGAASAIDTGQFNIGFGLMGPSKNVLNVQENNTDANGENGVIAIVNWTPSADVTNAYQWVSGTVGQLNANFDNQTSENTYITGGLGAATSNGNTRRVLNINGLVGQVGALGTAPISQLEGTGGQAFIEAATTVNVATGANFWVENDAPGAHILKMYSTQIDGNYSVAGATIDLAVGLQIDAPDYGGSATTAYAIRSEDPNPSVLAGPLQATMFHETLHTPATSSEACTAGQFTDDANFHYVCTATNTWKRVALSAF
jgi:hypothetical protein